MKTVNTASSVSRSMHHSDPRAFEILVLRYQERVYNLALRLLGDPDRAMDVTQEAFIKAFQGIRRFRRNSSFYTWIYRITVNLCRSHGRKARSLCAIGEIEGVRPITDPGQGPDKDVETKERNEAIHHAIGKLEKDLREVSILRDVDGLSYEEIAGVLGIPIGTVRSRLHRARELLRENLEEWLRENR